MRYDHAIILLTAVVAVSGCTSTSTASEGQFELLVSDQAAAIDDFDYLEVGFSEARIFATGNDTVNTTRIDLSNTSTSDLTQLRGASAESLVNTSLSAGNYSKIELYVQNVNASVDNESVDVKVPPGKLMIAKPFEIRPNETTSFVFDIQVTLRGNEQNNQGYILRPVISESGVAGEDVEVERTQTRDRGRNRSMNQRDRPPTPSNSCQGQGRP